MSGGPDGSAADRAEHQPARDQPPEQGLVGRDEELGQLRGLVTGLSVGRGRSVWIEGEPGIGKSALLTVGLAGARRLGCRTYATRADEAGGLFPLRVLFDALGVGPDARDPDRSQLWAFLTGLGRGTAGMVSPADSSTLAVAAEMLTALTERLCAAGPTVVAVDDLHWADDLSLAVWSRLQRAVTRLPLLLLATARPVPARAQMDRLRRAARAGGALVLRLEPLNESEVGHLVTRLAGAPPGPRLIGSAGQAGGNPLYLTELVEVLVRDDRIRVAGGVAEMTVGGDTPSSLAAAIGARLGFLSGPTAEVLRLAALLGVSFSAEHLRMLWGRPATEMVAVVAEAVTAGVVAESGSSLTFRHPLIRDALYQTTPAGLRAVLHRQAAETLAECGAPVEEVAHQLLLAPKTADQWTVSWLAATAPGLIHPAPQVARDLLRRVLASLDPLDSRRDELDTYLASALFLHGDDPEVAAVAQPLLARTRDPAGVGRVAWTLAYALLRLTEEQRAEAVTIEALRRTAPSPTWTARLRALRALIVVNGGRYEEARAAAVQAEAEGHRAGDWLTVGYALYVQATVHLRRQEHEALLNTLDRALATISEQAENADLRLLLLGNRAEVLSNLGRSAASADASAQALSLAGRAGTPLRRAVVRVQAAERLIRQGQWDEAIVQLGNAADVALDAARWPWLRGLAALVAVHRDQRGTAARNLEDPEVPAHLSGDVRYLPIYQCVARALAAERDNQPEQALRQLVDVLLTADQPGPAELYTERPLWLPDLTRLALSLEDPVSARRAAEACAAEALRHPLPHTRAAVRHCRGLLDASPDDIRWAADAYRSMGYLLYQAQALENAAVVSAQHGEAPAARADYAEAVRIYAGLRAAWDLRRADARLRPLGIRRGVRGPRRRPGTGWESLTPTELKIANLVAAGRSTPDIADELYMARRTVQLHISHILGKLGAQSRVEIARHAFQTMPEGGAG